MVWVGFLPGSFQGLQLGAAPGSTSLPSFPELESLLFSGSRAQELGVIPAWSWGCSCSFRIQLSACSLSITSVLSLQHPPGHPTRPPAEPWGPPSPPGCQGATAAWAVSRGPSSAPQRVARVTNPGTGTTVTLPPVPLVSCTPSPHPCFFGGSVPWRHTKLWSQGHFSLFLVCFSCVLVDAVSVTPLSLNAEAFLQCE